MTDTHFDKAAAKDVAIEVLSRHIMEIHRMPHEGHSIAGSYMECRHELCRAYTALAALKDVK